MNTETTPHRTLEEVEDLFKNWRRTRKSPKPMPRRLWEAATGLTAEHSIPAIAKRLLLDPTELKESCCMNTPRKKKKGTLPEHAMIPPEHAPRSEKGTKGRRNC